MSDFPRASVALHIPLPWQGRGEGRGHNHQNYQNHQKYWELYICCPLGALKGVYGSCCCVNAVGTALLCRPPRQKVMSFAAEIIQISCQRAQSRASSSYAVQPRLSKSRANERNDACIDCRTAAHNRSDLSVQSYLYTPTHQ